jgi:GNAT superfamily N-acetyltransferase
MRDVAAGLVIRPYEPSHHAAVRALVIDINRELAPAAMREAFEDYIARSLREEIDRIPEYYAARGGGFFVALEGDALVGVFGLERLNGAAAELRRMYVRRDRRRSGIAGQMLRHAEALCREAGCRRLTLSTSELQQAALALYRKSGYRLVREEISTAETNKAVAGLHRFHFEKELGEA